jgi:PST family polysaccharide transporter
LVCKTFKTSLVKPTYKMIYFQLQNSWHVFISKMSVHFYGSINIFVLGLLSNNLIVGYYSLAYKIYTALNGLFMPFSQALFPFLSKKYTENKQGYIILIRIFGKAYLIGFALLALITFVFSNDIVKLISGSYIPNVNEILRIFAVTLVFSIGSFCSPLLVIKSESKIVAKITIYSMILNLVLLFPAIYLGGAVGLAFTYLLVQLFQAALQLIHNPEIYKRTSLIKNI